MNQAFERRLHKHKSKEEISEASQENISDSNESTRNLENVKIDSVEFNAEGKDSSQTIILSGIVDESVKEISSDTVDEPAKENSSDMVDEPANEVSSDTVDESAKENSLDTVDESAKEILSDIREDSKEELVSDVNFASKQDIDSKETKNSIQGENFETNNILKFSEEDFVSKEETADIEDLDDDNELMAMADEVDKKEKNIIVLLMTLIGAVGFAILYYLVHLLR